MSGKQVSYSDNFQKHYRYTRVARIGKDFDKVFKPELTPKQMLKLGVFGGAYFIGVDGGIPSDLPKEWFRKAKLSESGKPMNDCNYFGVSASQSLTEWKRKGWIYPKDPHGWFQWYCRYYLGRRIPEEDARQIKRWRAITRHITQIKRNCNKGDVDCRPRQRQAVLHWAYDSRKY